MTTTRSFSNSSTENIDFSHIIGALRRRWLPVVLAPLLIGGATYTLSKRQAPVYQASSSLMAAPSDSGGVLGEASITASPLPQGAAEQVLHSRDTVKRILQIVENSTLSEGNKKAIMQDMNSELANGNYERLRLKARLDSQQRGTYEVQSSAETPQAARILADAAATALLEWDVQRVKGSVSLARENFQQQLTELNLRVAAATPGSVEQQALQTARAQLVLSLSQASVLEKGARGNLTLLSVANAPSRPVSPKPLRNSVLSALVSLFGVVGLALLLEAVGRKINSSNDLSEMGLPVLGELPYLSGLKRAQTVSSVKSGKLYEPTGFIRVNMSAALPQTSAVVAVTSARPGEGKSSAVAATAVAYALAGKRVLIIDLDLHRPMQQELWQTQGRKSVALSTSSIPQAMTVAQAVASPEFAGAYEVSEGIDLLPAGEGGRAAASVLGDPNFPPLLRQWSKGYDVVIIDTPPIRAVADALSIARSTDGLAMVVESQHTPVPDVERAVRDINTTGVRFLGVILNKVKLGEQGYYSYGYASAD
ncbi:polysaccharide biosynthesis tyrosine autokinase [Deinococcus hohokamensis]|uniref:Polysaccharide biosynthesis tyrosine autokinase n=1 Tax=Deinococcus hohokamensis TaxID=309883 RepID=A0ABV9ICD3_9DEIO